MKNVLFSLASYCVSFPALETLFYDLDPFQGHKAEHNHSCRGSH